MNDLADSSNQPPVFDESVDYWCLGIEVFTDDTEKAFNGSIIAKFHDKDIILNNPEDTKKLVDHVIKAYPDAIKSILSKVQEGKYWIHIFKHKHMANRPKDMFEAAADAIEKPSDRSFEEIMSDAVSPVHAEVESSPTTSETDFYFTADMKPLQGLPEKWILDLGLL
jgi:hypothetical protein